MKIKYLILICVFIFGIIFVTKITDIPFIGIESENNDIWNIGIYKVYKDRDNLKVISHPGINNPILTAKDVTDRKAKFVAEPF